MTLVAQSLAQRPVAVVSTPADYFHLLAVTEDGVRIEIDDLSPFPSSTSRSDRPTSYSTGFFSLKLPATGFETWDSGRLIAHLKSLNPKQASQADDTKPRDKFESLFAIIPDVKLLMVSGGTKTITTHPLLGETSNSLSNCLVGDIHSGKFCVEAKDGDLWVYYQRVLNHDQGTGPAAEKIFAGVLSAIGFTHGCHPWPFYYQHVRDHIVVERWARCCPDCARDALLPIESRRMFLSEDAQDLFRKACLFFSTDSEDAALTIRALWLMRASHRDSMPFEIRLITLCSVFEGMIHRLEEKLLTEDERYEKERLPDGGRKGKPRRGKWKLIVERLQLPWENVFGPAYQSWEFYRHPLSHGFQERSDEAPETLFDAYSRITAAIYILMAKAMGYSGEMASSALEDKRVSLGGPPPS